MQWGLNCRSGGSSGVVELARIFVNLRLHVSRRSCIGGNCYRFRDAGFKVRINLDRVYRTAVPGLYGCGQVELLPNGDYRQFAAQGNIPAPLRRAAVGVGLGKAIVGVDAGGQGRGWCRNWNHCRWYYLRDGGSGRQKRRICGTWCWLLSCVGSRDWCSYNVSGRWRRGVGRGIDGEPTRGSVPSCGA